MACRGTPQPFSGLNCITRQKRLVRVGSETRCGVARLHEGHRRQTRALGGPARPSAGDAAASGAQSLTSHRRRCTIVSPVPDSVDHRDSLDPTRIVGHVQSQSRREKRVSSVAAYRTMYRNPSTLRESVQGRRGWWSWRLSKVE